MKCPFCLLAMLLLFAATAPAQDLKSVTGLTNQTGIKVRFSATQTLPAAVENKLNYTLFEINTKKLEDKSSVRVKT